MTTIYGIEFNYGVAWVWKDGTHRTADWWNLRHHLSRWLSGRGVGGCYAVHSLRISCLVFLEFFHCHFVASISFVAISYPLLVEEDSEMIAVSFVTSSGGWKWT
jgi:hypothetical protein